MSVHGYHSFANGAVSTRSTTAAPEADPAGSSDLGTTSTGEPADDQEIDNDR